MSDLFYANLGIPNYSYEQDNAKYRFRDFINYLYLAKENEEKHEYSINWRLLKEDHIKEIVKSQFQFELTREEPYDKMDETTLEKLIEVDNKLNTKLQFRIQEQFEKINNEKQVWVRIYEKRRTEQGYKLIQNFFRTKYVYDSKELQNENRIRILDKEENFNALLLGKIPKNKEKLYLKYRAIPLQRQLDAMFHF
ncbi:unnamed protein product, partial [marine sediment metagenome]